MKVINVCPVKYFLQRIYALIHHCASNYNNIIFNNEIIYCGIVVGQVEAFGCPAAGAWSFSKNQLREK